MVYDEIHARAGNPQQIPQEKQEFAKRLPAMAVWQHSGPNTL
jgi:hypothetical protein